MPKISIVIPCYNNAQYLKRCLDSAINQTYQDIEIICIDDKSTDNSLEILHQYTEKDPRIKVLALSKNLGVSNARNVALNILTGDYVCFLDSDDYLEPTFCITLYECLLRFSADIACGGHIKVNSLNKRISPWVPKKDVSFSPISDIYSFTKHRNVTQKLFKTYLIKKYNLSFNKDLTYMEDAVFLMTYLKHSKIISGTDKVLYNVQINFNSICRNKNLKQRREKDITTASSIISELKTTSSK